MSEQNILNPTSSSQLNPDYAIDITDQETVARWQARSGKPFFRDLSARGLVWELNWNNRMQADIDALVQWGRQYEKDFFTFQDFDTGRYYSGMFSAKPHVQRAGFNKVNATAEFVVLPTLPLFQYPSRWGTDSVFIGVLNGFGSQLVKLTGTWNPNLNNAVYKGGNGYFSSTTGDTAEWIYFGYGFRYWTLEESADGIAEISLDGSVLGNVDLYNASFQASAVRFTQQNVPLGLHRVKLRVTGTKNASSSGFFLHADTVEAMR